MLHLPHFSGVLPINFPSSEFQTKWPKSWHLWPQVRFSFRVAIVYFSNGRYTFLENCRFSWKLSSFKGVIFLLWVFLLISWYCVRTMVVHHGHVFLYTMISTLLTCIILGRTNHSQVLSFAQEWKCAEVCCGHLEALDKISAWVWVRSWYLIKY